LRSIEKKHGESIMTRREQCEITHIIKTLAEAAQLVYKNTPKKKPRYWNTGRLLGIEQEATLEAQCVNGYMKRNDGFSVETEIYSAMLHEAWLNQ